MSRRIALRVLFCALAICALPSRAAAECGPRPVEACALVNNDAEIFIGRVLSQKDDGPEWRMRVVRSFRGTARGEVVVEVWSTGDLPSFATLRQGKDYLFYVSRTVEQGKTLRATSIACGSWLPLEYVSRSELDFLARLGDKKVDGRVFGSLGRRTSPLIREPLAGIRVFLRSASGTFSTVTNDRGEFDIGGLPAGAYEVATTVPPTLLVKVAGGPVELVPHGCTDVYLMAEPNTIISGRVTLPRGFALKDTHVAALDTTGRLVETTDADASGRYVLAGLKPGEYLVSLWTYGLPPDVSAPFLQTFAPGTTDQSRATRIPVDGPGVFDNVDIPVAEAQDIVTISVTAKDVSDRPIADASMALSFGGAGNRGAGGTDAKGVVSLRMVKGIRVYLFGRALGAGCITPLELGPTDYPAALEVTLTPDGCRQADNLQYRTDLARSARNGLATRRLRVVFPDGSSASDVHIGISSRREHGLFSAVFRTGPDGSLDLPMPLQSQFWIQASRFAQGVACQSEYVWFNTEGAEIQWQRRAKQSDAPNWEEGTESTGEIVLRLEGPTCAPAR